MRVVLVIVFCFFFFPFSNANAFDEQDLLKKDTFGQALKTLLTFNLSAEKIWYEDMISVVLDEDSEVSNIVVDVLPEYRDIDPLRAENLRIVSLACQKVGEMTQKTRWKSKYFKLIISKSDFGERSQFIFLTKECRKFFRLLKKDKGEAVAHWLQIFGRALKRGGK